MSNKTTNQNTQSCIRVGVKPEFEIIGFKPNWTEMLIN